MDSPIVVCEPQCRGFEHTAFNTALLWTTLLAYPDAAITFAGEAEHCGLVAAELGRRGPHLAGRVSFVPIALPAAKMTRFKRVAQEWRLWRELDRLCRASDAGLLLLCSVTSPAIIVRKLTAPARTPPAPMLAVIHSALHTLGAPPRGPLSRAEILGLRHALRLPHPNGLRFIVLGEPILEALRGLSPELARHFAAMDHPALWDAQPAPTGGEPGARPVRFGFIGVGTRNKGLDAFCRLALTQQQAIAARRCEFVLAGFVLDRECAAFPGFGLLAGAGFEPLPADELAARMRGLDYAVWAGDTAHYRLTASGSFVDALGFAKPCIVRGAPFVERYFAQMGDIGYLCDSADEMQAVIADIVTHFPRERYRQQCENILRGRSIFEPVTLASRLRQIVANMKPR